jgi:hypothetical protein
MAQKLLKYIVVVLITVNMVILGFVVWGRKSEPVVPLPNPNGYDDFVKAGQMLKGKPEDYRTMPAEELRDLVATNAEALKLVQVGLSRECRVPVDYSTNWYSQLFTAIWGFKKLAMVLSAEGTLAKLEGRTNDAAKIYLEGMRLGQESSRGGIMISRLVGMACEALEREQLRTLTNSLDAAQCRETVEALARIDATEEPLEDTLKQEATWARKASSFREKVESLVHYKSERESKARFVAKVQGNKLQRRQMMIGFAARAYELEKGKSPGSLSDLVPGYLKAIPQDPTTGTNLVYSPQ